MTREGNVRSYKIVDEVVDTSIERKTERVENSHREFVNQELEFSTGRMEVDTRIIDLISKELPDESKIGYMLPLNCGHNASPSLPELNLLQKHLIKARIIELADNS